MNSLPLGWALTNIGELTPYIQRGKSPKYTIHSELPVINQKCIRWNKLETEHLKFIHPDQIPSWDAHRYIQPGDILWNSTGTGTVGRAYLIKESDCITEKVVDSHVTILRASTEIDSRYLFNWIKSPNVQQKIEDMCEGSTNQIELNKGAISETEIPLAPFNEQKRIADKLEALLARVDACRDRLDNIPILLKHFRQSVLASATSGKLTEDWREESSIKNKFSDGNQIRLGSVCRLINGFAYSSKDYVSEGIPLVRISDIDGKVAKPSSEIFVPEALYDEKFLVRRGDVLVAMSGATTGKVGVYTSEMPALQNQRVGNLKISNPDKIIKGYRDLTLMASSEAILAGAYGGAQPNISSKDIENFEIFLPVIEEQTEIVRRVETLFAYTDRLVARYAVARAQVEKLTPATLAKAFRGELVPQDPSDEPASKLLNQIMNVVPDRKKNITNRKIHSEIVSLPPSISLDAIHKNDMKKQPTLKLSDVKKDHLSQILKLSKKMDSKKLWLESGLIIDEFYLQLNREICANFLRVSSEDESMLEYVKSS